MSYQPRTAMWQVTDTMNVLVDVLSNDRDGRTQVRSNSGVKWVPTSELRFDSTRDRRMPGTPPLRHGGPFT